MHPFVLELLVFGCKQARACLFATAFFTVLYLSTRIPFLSLTRYDFIFVAAVGIQFLLVLTGVETIDEALVLGSFHGVGLLLELFKTHPLVGSWSYPEAGVFKLGSVPLYSGFMYAAVASYMCQAWRILQLRLEGYPSYKLSVPLSLAIYLNFFTHHFIADLRWLLIVGVGLVFWRTSVVFTVINRPRRMPVVLAFALIGFFVWVAENLATYCGAWAYPDQLGAWTPVAWGKFSSWFLLVIISFIAVADLKHVRARRQVAPQPYHDVRRLA